MADSRHGALASNPLHWQCSVIAQKSFLFLTLIEHTRLDNTRDEPTAIYVTVPNAFCIFSRVLREIACAVLSKFSEVEEKGRKQTLCRQVLWGVGDWNGFVELLVHTVTCGLGRELKDVGFFSRLLFPGQFHVCLTTEQTLCCGVVEFQLHELAVDGPQWNLNYTSRV